MGHEWSDRNVVNAPYNSQWGMSGLTAKRSPLGNRSVRRTCGLKTMRRTCTLKECPDNIGRLLQSRSIITSPIRGYSRTHGYRAETLSASVQRPRNTNIQITGLQRLFKSHVTHTNKQIIGLQFLSSQSTSLSLFSFVPMRRNRW